VLNDPGKFSVDALLCDSAVVADGKLYIHGAGWNMLAATQLPFVQPRVSLAVVITVPYTETNRDHEFAVRLVDQDGREMPIGPGRRRDDGSLVRDHAILGRFSVGRPPGLASGDSQPLPLALNIDQMEFAAEGLFSFDLAIDGRQLSRLSFRIHTSVPDRQP
jgi:hypothetical protein